jgi:hAT family C-terminal dimerisation region
MPSFVKSIFDLMEQLVHLLLTNPVSNAEAERGFSSLRRLKTCMRSYMTQEHLNHYAVLHVHQHQLDALDIDEIVSLSSNVTRKELHSDALQNSQTEQVFQIDSQWPRHRQPFGLGVQKQGVWWMRPPRLVNRPRSILISIPTPQKKLRFCAKLVTHPAGY